MNALNTKIRNLKRDKEETEGELETNKSRVRQLRSQLEEAEENASALQAQMTKLRSANRKKVCFETNVCAILNTVLLGECYGRKQCCYIVTSSMARMQYILIASYSGSFVGGKILGHSNGKSGFLHPFPTIIVIKRCLQTFAGGSYSRGR